MVASNVVIKKLSTPLSDPLENSVNIKLFRKCNVATQCVKLDLIMTKTKIGIKSSTDILLCLHCDVADSARRKQPTKRRNDKVINL